MLKKQMKQLGLIGSVVMGENKVFGLSCSPKCQAFMTGISDSICCLFILRNEIDHYILVYTHFIITSLLTKHEKNVC